MNIVLTIFGGFLTVIGLLAILVGVSFSSLSTDFYGGKNVWLERSSEEPYFWSVSALDDKGQIKFVDGWQDEAMAKTLFSDLAEGRVSRTWVREHDEERTRQRDREREARPKPILVEAK